MEQAFDAYYKWLGIPPECQPPHHYRLLGLQTFETDPDVIQAAADQRMMHLRAYQTGRHSELSQRLLNEVAAAKVCLLNAAKKSAYDAQLRKSLTVSPPIVQPPQAAAPPSGPTLSFEPDALSSRPRVPASPILWQPKQLPIGPIIGGLVAVVMLLIIGVVYWVSQTSEPLPTTGQSAKKTPVPSGKHGANVKTPEPVGPNGKDRKTKTPSSNPPTTPEKQPVPKTPVQPETKSHDQGPDGKNPPDATERSPSKSSSDASDVRKAIGDSIPKNHESTPAKTPKDEPLVPPPDNRPVEPPTDAQETAMKLARDLFKDKLAKARMPDEKQALAKDILDQARAASNADAGTFVLFRLARELSTQALDGQTALATVDAMSERFRIDSLKYKMELLTTFAKKVRLPSQHLAVAEQAMRAMLDAQADEDFDRAADLARLAMSEGNFGHDKDLATLAKTSLKDCQQAAAIVAQSQAAKTTLADKPDDPAANFAVGIYYAGLKKDWPRALPCLAKGNDPDFKTLAQRELKSPPNSAEDQVSLSDAWWDAAQKSDEIKKTAMIDRSAFWCKKALNELVGGLSKVKAEKRLDEIAKIERESVAAVLDARPTVPINKWFPLLTSPNELTGWDTSNCHFTYTKGIIELREREMFCPIVAKDASIRAKVKCRSDAQLSLVIRKSSQGCYAAQISYGVLSIVKQTRTGQDVLSKVTLPRPRKTGDAQFEFGFSAVGNVLTVFINQQPRLTANDATLSQGIVGIGTLRTNNLYFSDVAMLIPKGSFVADQRASAAKKTSLPEKPLISQPEELKKSIN
jgi:hypothetical protein